MQGFGFLISLFVLEVFSNDVENAEKEKSGDLRNSTEITRVKRQLNCPSCPGGCGSCAQRCVNPGPCGCQPCKSAAPNPCVNCGLSRGLNKCCTCCMPACSPRCIHRGGCSACSAYNRYDYDYMGGYGAGPMPGYGAGYDMYNARGGYNQYGRYGGIVNPPYRPEYPMYG